ncbi:MAG: alanine--tRNA ligase [Christensenellales bacterium]|jgi:alanyl-tRNA synthetase
MEKFTVRQLRDKYREFFESKGHTRIPSASIIPENDPSVLFTTAGMHPLVPYLLGERHPAGTRLTNSQKCVRTGDIDEVGDAGHLTFFEMLGNWSLGDYFKQDMIAWSWEFLTEVLGIDPESLAVSVFAGDENAPRDEESAARWEEMGLPRERIFYLPKENNWWGAGETGPCGPDTEMFVIRRQPCGPDCTPACDCGAYLEIWNDVFMTYNRQDGKLLPLPKRNVDTGMGLERTMCILNDTPSVYETEIFAPTIAWLEEASGKPYGVNDKDTRAMRIIADHIRTATFILADDKGLTPANVDQGYVLRRLIRRAVRMGMQLGLKPGFTPKLAELVIHHPIYEGEYDELIRNEAFIKEQFRLEEERFQRTLASGIKEFERYYSRLTGLAAQIDSFAAPVTRLSREAVGRMEAETEALLAAVEQAYNSQGKRIEGIRRNAPRATDYVDEVAGLAKQLRSTLRALKEKTAAAPTGADITGRVMDGQIAFRLYDTFGFPIEMTVELAGERGMEVDVEGFHEAFKKHQATSQAGSEQKFKGGLADHDAATARLHTATHLLHAALRTLIDSKIEQRGSNITPERLRFDFSFGRKLEDEEISALEKWVNDAIAADAAISCEEMSLDLAEASGAIGLFGSKYGDRVKVYTMGPFSKEICGGPHAARTGELGHFIIQKEQASSAGVRRIRAVLEQ